MKYWQPKYFLILAWSLVSIIVVLSLIPGNDMPRYNWQDQIHLDKWGHLLLYGFTAWCFRKYSAHSLGTLNMQFIYFALLVMGIALECTQYLMHSGRQFDLFDIIANSLGIGLVAIVKKT